MNRFTTTMFVAFAFLATATFTNCAKEEDNMLWLLALGGGGGSGSGANGESAVGQGGPNVSPEGASNTKETATETSTDTEAVDTVDQDADGDGSGAGAGSEADGSGSGGEETAAGGDSGGGDAAIEETIDEEIASGSGTGGADDGDDDGDVADNSGNTGKGNGNGNAGNNGNAGGNSPNENANGNATGGDNEDANENANGNANTNQGNHGKTPDEGENEFGDDLDDGEDLADGDPDADFINPDGTIDEDLAEADDESDDEGAFVEDSGEEAVVCADRRIELDTSAGKWFETPQGTVGRKPSKAERNAVKQQIKKLQNQIKDIRKQVQQGEAARQDGRNAIALLKKDIAAARASLGFGNQVKGIHTFWADQPLYLRVRNNCQAGWYKLKIVAKNYSGPLPADYSHYTLDVSNETYGDSLGGVHIKAADDGYNRGRKLVYLDTGDTDLKLNWINDAYKEGVYDANIQIKRIKLKYKKVVRNRRSLMRRAHQYCEVDGRWFWDSNSARTYWANQRLSFCFPDLPGGKYSVRIDAKNYGDLGLPKNYKNFLVDVSGDGVSSQASIKADDRHWRKGETVLDLTGGRTRIDLVWRNDDWKKDVHDANFQIKKIHLKRIGDSERSALAAYLMANSSRTGILTLVLGLLALGGLLGIQLWKRRQEA